MDSLQDTAKQSVALAIGALPDPERDILAYLSEIGEVWHRVEQAYRPLVKDVLGGKWEAHSASSGSIYIMVDIPLDAATIDEANDVERHKITIRDHDVSPFRAAEFGRPTKVIQIESFDSKGDVSNAAVRLISYLSEILAPHLQEKAAGPISEADGGGIRQSRIESLGIITPQCGQNTTSAKPVNHYSAHSGPSTPDGA